ncbi:MAG: ArsA family ATPase [Thermoanaerobaculia bacterium]|nr:ArsA family ATPase [Thermoanaerobaculia bacterium]
MSPSVPLPPAPPDARPASTYRPTNPPELLVVTGKGGVGKTTVSAALGLHLSARGARVLIVEMDPRENVHRLLGLPPSGGDQLEATPALSFQNLRPRAVVDTIVQEQVRVGWIADRVLASPVYDHFVGGCPGLEELAILGHALRSLQPTGKSRSGKSRSGKSKSAESSVLPFDHVVLDAPATGHGLALLAAPRLVAEVIQKGPFGRLASELAVFVDDPGRCGVVAVTTAEAMPAQETLELIEALRRDHRRDPELVVVNGFYPPFPDRAPVDAIDRQWLDRRTVNERSLETLHTSAVERIVTLPWVAADNGVQLARALAHRLDEEWSHGSRE